MNGPDVSCTVFVELVTDYLEGALSDDEQARFEGHLALCPHCVEVLEQWRTVVDLAGRLPELYAASAGPDVRTALMDAFRSSRGTTA